MYELHTSSDGNNGGTANNVAPNYFGAGGGGAGSVGLTNGSGGNGKSNNITGVTLFYAGGGAGGYGSGTGWVGTIGSGIGGSGSTGNGVLGGNGTPNTGSGGGGYGSNIVNANMSGGNGGSGIVIIRYKTTKLVPSTQQTGFLNYTNMNGWSLSQVSAETVSYRKCRNWK